MMNEFLEQAKAQSGDTRQDLSALTCAMIAQAEAMERIAVALEKISVDTDLLSDLVMKGNYIVVKTIS